MTKALVLDQIENKTHFEIKEIADSDLPGGDVLIGVEYSSLNY